jgi:hypothetical protein
MTALPSPLDEEFRDVGFTGLARNYPRDDFAVALLAAFNGVSVEQLSPAMRFFPNSNTAKAWGRVAEAARAFLADQRKGE